MKLISAEISGLFDKKDSVRLLFHEDLNIITGKNGSGKTTIMKLIWYVISGQIVRALTEVPFQRVSIDTSIFQILIVRTGENTCRIRWTEEGKTREFRDEVDEDGDLRNAEDVPNARMRSIGSSIFFPTFRRIEGGFSSSQSSARHSFSSSRSEAGDLDLALKSLSDRLSTSNHRFVSALSTSDIESLLLKQYTDASEHANRVQQETSSRIIAEIREFKQEKYEADSKIGPHTGNAEAVLDSIRNMIDDMERQRQDALSQYNAIRDLVLRIFQHTGIKVGRLSMGDTAASISSDVFSAGEKQMLSFLCYNAFYHSSIVFIDEPELSLHVDWQKQLFPTLFSQKKNNQFFIATHSPFIYSRYPDKEIRLQSDRGDDGFFD
ncbi:AAA family ATPase [Sphingopyxis terrae]|uniref:Predicted ATP-binding protein involved in virulence n=1 Tax=Sphingopyxis terrae subsp. ummariensis TaxID=429001 RepID=A0A1Y6EW48_9SPHN|nr:AAA family ATPase [Sphingopyxis terrae]SMQ65190.1 Predicted ATP-binding protein involved in virulence [Sphingopyxis terrae subsp. ummariensis]